MTGEGLLGEGADGDLGFDAGQFGGNHDGMGCGWRGEWWVSVGWG